MIPDLEVRIAVAYLLALKTAIHWGLASPSRAARRGPAAALLGGWYLTAGACVARGLFVIPLVVFVLVPELLAGGQFRTSERLWWFATVPAAAAIVMLPWAWRSLSAQICQESVAFDKLLETRGPFRLIRYPFEAANEIFYLAIALATANWQVIGLVLLAVITQRSAILPQIERQRRRQWGAAYEAYAARTGKLIPHQLMILGDRQYTVPRRFGMAAIVALFTGLGILFGILRYWNADPAVYLFVASEIVAICLAQIAFGSAPRGVSILTGALLLPFWVKVTLLLEGSPQWMTPQVQRIMFAFLFSFGGLLGYCIGALAAGFFLVMDLVEANWERSRAAAAMTGGSADGRE